MATKAPAKKPAAKKSTSTALTLWEEEMAQAAIDQGSTEKTAGGFKSISLKGGILAIDDNAVEDNEMRVIVLASVHENQLYEDAYDPSSPSSPKCYAFGDNEDEMAPHEEAPDKQSDSCATCWANEWASADKGKGKACKNVRRLVCITEDALESGEALMEAEARMLKLPVMSVKNWSTYVKQTLTEEIKRPSWGVVTAVKVVPDAKSQFRVQFKFEELVNFTQETYDAMRKRATQARESAATAYPVFEEEEKPVKRGRTIPIKPVAGKPTGKAPAKAAAPVKRGGKY